MAETKFTTKWIEGPGPATKGGLWWDTDTKGLGVRVNTRGDRVLLVNVFVKGGKRHRITLGTYGLGLTLDQAREKAGAYIQAAIEGRDKFAEEQRNREAQAGRLTFSEIADKWLDMHVRPKRSPRTAEDYEAVLRRYLRPAFGSRCPDEISKSEVTRLHVEMVKTPKAANYSVVVGKAMMNFAIETALVPKGTENPFTGVELYDEEGRERFLSLDEIGAIGNAIKALEDESRMSPWTAAALRLLMLTGARSGEIKSLKWDYIDFERRAMFLPTSKTGRKTIHLNPPTIAILQALPRVNGNPHVVVGQVEGQPLATLRQAWDLVRDRTGLHDVRIHDLRHTYASFGASSGLSLPVIGRILGHTVPATTARYAHLADGAVKEANDTIGAQIAAALGEQPSRPPAEIVVMPKRRRG